MPVTDCESCEKNGSRLGQSLIALDGKTRYHQEVDRRSQRLHLQWHAGWNAQRDQILNKLRVIDEHLDSLAEESSHSRALPPRLSVFEAAPPAVCAEVF